RDDHALFTALQIKKALRVEPAAVADRERLPGAEKIVFAAHGVAGKHQRAFDEHAADTPGRQAASRAIADAQRDAVERAADRAGWDRLAVFRHRDKAQLRRTVELGKSRVRKNAPQLGQRVAEPFGAGRENPAQRGEGVFARGSREDETQMRRYPVE